MIKKEQLKKKGWTDHEIHQTEQLLYSEREDKHQQTRKRIHHSLFWLSFLVLIVSNFVVLLGVMPFLLRIEDVMLIYVVLGSFGFVFGSLFASMVTELDQLKTKHHVLAVILYPIILSINIALLLSTYTLNKDIQHLLYPQVTFMVSAYMLLFLIPYIMFHFISPHDKKILLRKFLF